MHEFYKLNLQQSELTELVCVQCETSESSKTFTTIHRSNSYGHYKGVQ